MRCTWALLGFLFATCAASAHGFDPTSNVSPGMKVPVPGTDPFPIRSGGERCGNATVIPSLPFQDIASTSGANDTYFWACPSAAGGGRDVVYKYTPAVNEAITIDLCGSYYDTKVYVYESECSGTPIGCNDDACSGPNYPSPYLSYLSPVPLYAGVTYYIVVDGDGPADYGTYDLKVTVYEGPVIFCPTDAQMEDEPLCQLNYEDHWNGGCNSVPHVFQPILPSPGQTSAVMCGESGTYLFNGFSYRDTDWFACQGSGGWMTASVIAEFPVQLVFFYNADCAAPQYGLTVGDAYQTIELSDLVPDGDLAWIWVGPNVFNGIECGSDYVLTMTGIGGGVSTGVQGVTERAGAAVKQTSWGAVKKLYR